MRVPEARRTTQLPSRCRAFFEPEKCSTSLTCRSPTTMSAGPARIGAPSFGMSAARYWLSASVLTITSAPSFRPASIPAWKAAASPLLLVSLTTWSTPHSRATSTVRSLDPSSMTSHSTRSKPSTARGSSVRTWGRVASSFRHGIWMTSFIARCHGSRARRETGGAGGGRRRVSAKLCFIPALPGQTGIGCGTGARATAAPSRPPHPFEPGSEGTACPPDGRFDPRSSPRSRGSGGGSTGSPLRAGHGAPGIRCLHDSRLCRDDLSQPAVERRVARAHRGELPAYLRLVLADGGRERGEAPLDQVSLADRVELSPALEHPHWTHGTPSLGPQLVDRFSREREASRWTARPQRLTGRVSAPDRRVCSGTAVAPGTAHPRGPKSRRAAPR